jgi:CSLREA domain-containing protein
VALVALASPGVAGAKTYRVNKTGDTAPGACTRSDCTLREAVIAANARAGSDTIVLRGGKVYNLALPGSGEEAAATGDLDVTDALAIRPAKPRRRHRARRATIDANDLDRALQVTASATFTRLVVRDGTTPGVDDGGGIEVNGGRLTVSRSVVTQNVAGGLGGGLSLAGTTPAGSLKVLRSKVTGNNAMGDGGGGVNSNGGVLVVARTTISGNHSDNVAGGLRNSDGDATIIRSTVNANVADNTSGGLRQGGTGSHLTILNSTFDGNRAAGEGGGMRISEGAADLNGVTIVRNLANSDNTGPDVGGGIQEDSLEPITIRNTVIALNAVGTGGTDPNCFADITSGGHNVRGSADAGCIGFTGPGDQLSATPRIGALKNNGGPTKTACPKAGSILINQGGEDAVSRDQRGVKKVGRRDIGACEFVPRPKKHRRR